MHLPNNNQYILDEKILHKYSAKNNGEKILSNIPSNSLIKTASSYSNEQLIELFAAMLKSLNLSCGNTEATLKNIVASKKVLGKEENKTIKIVSKEIKDSHYDVEISKDFIKKNSNSLIMVSCYAKDNYLGRYIIKRNYYFSSDRENAADETYSEIITKMASLKERYYENVINVSEITTQMKKVLDGVISEISSEENSLGTTVSR